MSRTGVCRSLLNNLSNNATLEASYGRPRALARAVGADRGSLRVPSIVPITASSFASCGALPISPAMRRASSRRPIACRLTGRADQLFELLFDFRS